MGQIEELAVREFLREREMLVGGVIVFWDKLFPDAPIRAEILAIEEVCYEGNDFRDIVVFTDNFVSVLTDPDAPLPKWRHFSFMCDPLSASVCHACNGMWVIAVPYVGVAHLHFRK